MHKRLFLILVMLFAMTALVGAQDITPRPDDEIDANANITWPPPVYVLRGEVEILGTADVPDMSSYFIEFRPLEFEDMTETEATDTAETDDEDDEAPWFPATLPNNEPITDGTLGVWNTETAPDDLYEVRLVINVRDSDPIYFYVSPLRVENDPPQFVLDALGDFGNDAPLPTATRPAASTAVVTPTPLDTTPRVTAELNANVRSGPGLDYERIDTLLEGETARVVGLSASGNGWYYIEMDDGDRGWIAPSVVTPSGQISSVPRINPPATPTPIATETPVPTANLAASPPSLTPAQPTCNEQFEILINITNNGTARTSTPVTVLFRDVHVPSGQVQTSFVRDLPQLDPGQNFVLGGPMTISTFFNEEHRIEVILDSNNQISETNETDNLLSVNYVLQPGTCG